MNHVVAGSFGDSPHKLTTGTRHFEQALRVDRPSSALSFATTGSLPATQGQRSEDRQSSRGT
jgi:hypothetical protein